MEEYWANIRNHKNYEISNLGNVRLTSSKKLTTITLLSSGYKTTSINGKTKFVHRLMAKTFLPKIQVNHINGIKSDNELTNLEWSNGSLNTKHSYTLELAKRKIRHEKLRKIVPDIRSKYTGARGQVSLLAKEFNCSYTAVYDIVNNNTWRDL